MNQSSFERCKKRFKKTTMILNNHMNRFKVSKDASNQIEIYNALYELRSTSLLVIPMIEKLEEIKSKCSTKEELKKLKETDEDYRKIHDELKPHLRKVKPYHLIYKEAVANKYLTFDPPNDREKPRISLNSKM